ncbi:erythroblast NAD(P)(+)--arginine ADP-ribosyltransferase-like, partial [Strigops habroptila]
WKGQSETPTLAEGLKELLHSLTGQRVPLYRTQFKTLHFLLSQVLRTLRGTKTHCHCHCLCCSVRNISFTAQPNQSVRFGHFTSTSLSKESIDTFGNNTTFTVETCCGALIRDFSFFHSEEEILIPPSEIFQVTTFTRAGQRSLIQLRSQGAKSNFNCELVKEKRCGTAPCAFGGTEPRDPCCGAASAGPAPALTGSSALWGLLLAALAAVGGP